MRPEKQEALEAVLTGRMNLIEAANHCGVKKQNFRDFAWQQAKLRVIERDSGLCRRCRSNGMDVHHRIARGMGGSWNAGSVMPCNLICLCRDCHNWIEAHPDEARATGFRLQRPDDPETVAIHDLYGQMWVLEVDGSVCEVPPAVRS